MFDENTPTQLRALLTGSEHSYRNWVSTPTQEFWVCGRQSKVEDSVLENPLCEFYIVTGTGVRGESTPLPTRVVLTTLLSRVYLPRGRRDVLTGVSSRFVSRRSRSFDVPAVVTRGLSRPPTVTVNVKGSFVAPWF